MESDMNNERFTQGEWRIVHNHHFCDIEGPSSRIANMCASGFGPTAKNHADAHLISAAPDMYRALRGLFELLSFDDKYMHLEEVKEAQKALAKADGEV